MIGVGRRGCAASNLLHLVVPDLDGRLAPEDGYQHLELGRVLVDLRDLTREVGERTGDHLDRFADRELGPARDLLRDLAVQQAVDLGLGERDRLVGGADEPGHARRALDDLPGDLVEVHVHEPVGGHGPLLDRDLLVVLHLLDRLRRDDDLAHGARLVQGCDSVLEVLLDLVLVPGIGVDDVPAKHEGFLVQRIHWTTGFQMASRRPRYAPATITNPSVTAVPWPTWRRSGHRTRRSSW